MQTVQTPRNPMLWVPSGYFTMALMYNLLTGATVLMFSNVGMDNATATTYAGMLGLAYTIKPLFAPFWKCTAPKNSLYCCLRLFWV